MIPPGHINLPKVTKYQQSAIFCPEKYAVVEATTKAGKTYGCILWLLSLAGSDRTGGDGREFWWVAPIYPQAGIAYNRTKEMLRKADPRQIYWSHNDSALLIHLSNGSRLRFKSAEKPDGLFGEDVWGAVMDEASRCREDSWHALRSTVTSTEGMVRIIGNVKGRKNWAYALARRAESGSLSGWHYAKITAHDAVAAGVMTQQAVEEAREVLPEDVFRELYLAEPSEDGSNPFGLTHIAKCVGMLCGTDPVAFGVDLGQANDWTVVIGIDAAGNTCAFDRWRRIPWSDTTARILAMIGDTPALVDMTGVGKPIVEALQQESPQVEGFMFTAPSKQELMGGLAVAIQSGNVSYPEGVIRVELEAFEYEHTLRSVRYTAPEGMHDDCVCALALAVLQRSRTGGVAQFRIITADDPVVTDILPINRAFAEARKDINFGFEED